MVVKLSRRGTNQFSKRLALRADRFIENSARISKDAATAALETAIEHTPVDTSKAVSNWIVTRDGPNRDVIDPYAPGQKGNTATLSKTAALAFGRAEIEDFDPERDVDLFLTNNVRYLRYIDGSGILALAAMAAKAAISNARLLS